MKAKCQICDKKRQSGHKVSHSNIKTKRTWAPNIQKVKVMVDGAPKRITVCTRCLRGGKVERAI